MSPSNRYSEYENYLENYFLKGGRGRKEEYKRENKEREEKGKEGEIRQGKGKQGKGEGKGQDRTG